jgi:hypothetical protein
LDLCQEAKTAIYFRANVDRPVAWSEATAAQREARIDAALLELASSDCSLSRRAVAAKHGVPPSTLQRRDTKRHEGVSAEPAAKHLSHSEEKEIVEFIAKQSDRGMSNTAAMAMSHAAAVIRARCPGFERFGRRWLALSLAH